MSTGAAKLALRFVLIIGVVNLFADLTYEGGRSTGFGLFDTGFGIAWFLGSTAMGLLDDRSIPGLVAFSVALQLAALPVFGAANAGLTARDRAGGGAEADAG